MKDTLCVEFLQWALPKLGMRWSGFRKVRRQVCRRIERRRRELGLPSMGAYRDFLETHPDPDSAPSDGPNMVPLDHVSTLLGRLLAIRQTVENLS